MGRSEFLHGLESLTDRHRGCVATIGSYDGVHRGHQQVLHRVVSRAAELSLPSLVMVFEPQPVEYFAKAEPPVRLTRLRDKTCLLFGEGIDWVLCLKFNEALRSLTAEEYIDTVLVDGLGVRHLAVGDDFRFGCDRSGDFAMLQRAGEQHGFTVSDSNTYTDNSERISSTRIRELLAKDELEKAEQLLGRPYSISGRVCYGRQLGRKMGFPTLNIGMGRYRPALQGVYAVEVSGGNLPAGSSWQGVANIGWRPTVDGGARPLLEVHLLDQDENLYGVLLSVTFRKKIRQEQRFESIDALKKQIEHDSHAARKFFATQ